MRNWKTSLTGVMAGIAMVLSQTFPEYSDVFKCIAGACVAMTGLLAKDHDVSGAKPTETYPTDK